MQMSKVKFGVEIPTFAGGSGAHRDVPVYERISYETAKETALLAEKAGYDSIWMADHFVLGRYGEMFEIWTLMSAFAALTERVELGTLVMCNLHRYPSVLAKMAATLDIASNGRLILGVGAGWNESELKSYGIPFPPPGERVARMKEGIKIMKAMWRDDKPTYKGKYYQIDDATCLPRPIKHGGPPVIVGAVGPRMLKAVAEVGDGWNLGDDPTIDVYKEKLAVVNQACSELGRDPNSVMKTWDGHVIIGKNQREFEELATSLKKHKATDKIGTTQLIPSNIFEDCIAGTPDACIEKIKRFAAIGVSHFSLWFLDYPHFEGIKLFAEQVIPAFR